MKIEGLYDFPAPRPKVWAALLDPVALERHERIATLTLDRPDRRNSLSDPLLQDLITALTQTEGFLPRE